LGAVATSVVMPLSSAATLSGIISRLGAVPVFCAIRSTIGMKIATTPVELMTDPSDPTTSISKTSMRASLLPARSTSQSPSLWATPVRASPSPITKSAAMSTMLGSLNPASASPMLIVPVSGSAAIMISATASMRGLLRANMVMAAASRASTIIRSWLIDHPEAGRKSARQAPTREPSSGDPWMQTPSRPKQCRGRQV
jgi:hypothetical protein